MAHPTVSEVGRYDLRIFEAFACDFCCDILAKGEFLPIWDMEPTSFHVFGSSPLRS